MQIFKLRAQRKSRNQKSRRILNLSFFLGIITPLVVISQIVSTTAYSKSAERSGPCDVVTLQHDNDEMGGTDRHYTGANRLACVTSPPRFMRDLVPPIDELDALTRTRAIFALGLSAFTPDDISRSDLIEDDQPYAGWLYVGLGLEREVVPKSDQPRYMDNVELQLGIVGPWSGAEHVQKFTHDLTNATEPKGWGNQLDNEPGINLFYSRQWTGAAETKFKPFDDSPDLFFDYTPEVGFALGNIHIFGAAGITFRLGTFQPDDHGPPTIRPSLPGSDYFPRQKGFSAYLFGGVEGRIVGRNIFLDGNTFQDDGPSVDKNTLVGEARVGVALTYDRVRLTYTHVFRSQEFENQPDQTYGSIALSVAF
ncbi:MAG: lipid A deacylase LpxR family protein [Geminicoccaceae bacterium]